MMVQVCPYCREAEMSLFLGGYGGILYRCGNCGYVGPLVVEMSGEEYEKLMLKKRKGKWKKIDQE